MAIFLTLGRLGRGDLKRKFYAIVIVGESQLNASIDLPGRSTARAKPNGLIVFPGALGDFVCFLPTLKWIADRHRAVPLELAMRSDFADLVFPREPAVSVRSLDCHEIGRLFSVPEVLDARIVENLQSYEFIYSWLGAEDRGFRSNLESHYRGELRILPFRPKSFSAHIADYYFSGLADGDSAPEAPAIALQPAEVAWRRALWGERRLAGKKVIALAPGSGAGSKNWPLAYFEAVAQWWVERTGGKVLVLWGPAELDHMAEPGHWKETHVVHGLSLGRLAALLAGCDLYLGNDSGTSHLAAAVGVPTVVLFGPTDPVQWRPRGKRVWILGVDLACSPCGLSVSRSCNHRRCLAGLSPERVENLLEGILAERLLDKV
ncbi:MAG TPA: glycosyltransferase family 9 protein [Candidatus Binatia bacterium]